MLEGIMIQGRVGLCLTANCERITLGMEKAGNPGERSSLDCAIIDSKNRSLSEVKHGGSTSEHS
jgi:hypothetical protein